MLTSPNKLKSMKTILILAVNPKDITRLRLDEEVREIDEGLKRSKNRDQFIIKPQWAIRLRDLRRALLDYEPRIVHFCGHGTEDGLMVENEKREAVIVSPDALSGLFKLFAKKIECVLLNACHSEPQAEDISKHIKYVIGMKESISDEAAREFAIGFYDALGSGKSFEDAFEFGCNAIQMGGASDEHRIPVLLKEGVNIQNSDSSGEETKVPEEQAKSTPENTIVHFGPNTQNYANLEISLHKQTDEQYRVILGFDRSDTNTKEKKVQKFIQAKRFEQLSSFFPNDPQYGTSLGKCLFDKPEILTKFNEARIVAQNLQVPLRIQLDIALDASELHRIHWETLRNPMDDYRSSFFTNHDILFSRYLGSDEPYPRRALPKEKLRSLVVIASPNNLNEFDSDPLNEFDSDPLNDEKVKEELKRAKSILGDDSPKELVSGNATVNGLFSCLADGCDILYLLAHGKIVGSRPYLALEKKQSGETDWIEGSELANRFGDLSSDKQPYLVVLASCQSANTKIRETGVLTALGPQFMRKGAPAVIAMRGNITIETVNRFMPVFFQELRQNGQIDRAMAVARGSVLERRDWWMPVLFMRLKDGRIWSADPQTSQKTSSQSQSHKIEPIHKGLTEKEIDGNLKHFENRDEKRGDLKKSLFDKDSYKSIVIGGAPGIGKSALAAKFLKDFKENMKNGKWQFAEDSPKNVIIICFDTDEENHCFSSQNKKNYSISFSNIFSRCIENLSQEKRDRLKEDKEDKDKYEQLKQKLNEDSIQEIQGIREEFIKSFLNELDNGFYIIILNNMEGFIEKGTIQKDLDLRTLIERGAVGLGRRSYRKC